MVLDDVVHLLGEVRRIDAEEVAAVEPSRKMRRLDGPHRLVERQHRPGQRRVVRKFAHVGRRDRMLFECVAEDLPGRGKPRLSCRRRKR